MKCEFLLALFCLCAAYTRAQFLGYNNLGYGLGGYTGGYGVPEGYNAAAYAPFTGYGVQPVYGYTSLRYAGLGDRLGYGYGGYGIPDVGGYGGFGYGGLRYVGLGYGGLVLPRNLGAGGAGGAGASAGAAGKK